jgi:hypothetical protein
VEASLVTGWTLRHARVRGLLAAVSVCLCAGLALILVTDWRQMPTSLLIAVVVFLVWNLWEVQKGLRAYRVMRRLEVRVTADGFRAVGHRGRAEESWEDVARIEIDRSSEPLGRISRQQAVYVVLHDGRRIELDALRVDGLRTVSRKRALLEPYKEALEAAAR